MTVWMVLVLMVIILGVGFYFFRKPLSPIVRMVVAGITLMACGIVWLVTLAPNAPMKMYRSEDRSLSQPQSTIPGPEGGTAAPAAPAAPPTPGKTSSKVADAKPSKGETDPAEAPASDAAVTAAATTEPGSIIKKVSDAQLDALIGDDIPVQPKGSTMVKAIVKKGTIKAADRNSPSDEDYSFPEVIQGSDGMVMIIPDDPLPSISSRRQLTTVDDDIPGTGDVVALTYDMFHWSTGEMVESSQTALNGPLVYRLGGENTPVGIPRYLDEAIHNRSYGSTVQVIFEKNMIDLPGYMDRKDGYVLVVRIDRPETDGEAALENMMTQLTSQ